MNEVSSPSPKKVPFELTQHNDKRIDNYYWIRDDERNDPEVIEISINLGTISIPLVLSKKA